MLRSVRIALSLLIMSLAGVVFAAEPVRIGVSLGLTGKYSEMSRQKLNAFKLWQGDINGRGGLLGRPVELVVYDDQSDAAQARERYEQLIRRDKVDLVFGPYSSEITEAAAAVTEKYGYPLLTSGAAADELWEKRYTYLFGVYITSSKYTDGFMELLVSHGLRTIAVISADDLFSQSLAAGAMKLAARYGLRVAYTETFAKDARILDSVSRRARDSGAEVLLVCGHFEESVRVREALKRIDWSPKAYFAAVGPALDKFRDVLQTDADLAFSASQWEPNSPFPGAANFAKAYSKAYNQRPAYQAAAAYAAGQILETAVTKSASIDRKLLRDTLSTLDTITIVGRYGVDRTGKQIRHFAVTTQWQNGERKIVAPRELMNAQPIWK